MNPSPPGDSGGFLARNLSRILVGALVGFLVGGFFALRSPAGFEATTEVLVTRLAVTDLGENSFDSTTPIDAEIRFAQSGTVRDAVRGAIPTAPNTIRVEASENTNVLAFTAGGDTADEAIRLSRNWSSAYISQRRDVLIATWTDRVAMADTELELLITDLGTARLAGDDAEAARLETRRDLAASEEAAAMNSIQALEADPGAELFGLAPVATRTGRSLVAMTILGTILGALATGVWRRWREQQADDEAEADSWLHQATEGSLDLVMTAGMLEVPAFLAPGFETTVGSAGNRAALSTTAPRVSNDQPGPTAQPTAGAAPNATVAARPTATATAARPPSQIAPANPAPRAAARVARTPVTAPKPPPQPLRIAKIGNGRNGGPTQRPALPKADRAWADDISLTTDV